MQERWLTTFTKQGKQGCTGTFLNEKGEQRVFKFDPEPSFTMQLEHAVMSTLQTAMPHMPHFIKSFGVKKRLMTPSRHSEKTPWKGKHLWPIDVLELEFVANGVHLSSTADSSTKKGWSSVQQVLCANAIASDLCGFTHYDLHSDNIMCVENPCDVHVYTLPDGKIMAFRTFKVLAKVIDFGFSWVNGLKYPPHVGFTEYGFVSASPDTHVDARLLMTSLNHLQEASLHEPLKSFKAFMNPIQFCNETGWIPLALNIEQYLCEQFPIEIDDPESIFHEDLIATLVRSFVKRGGPMTDKKPNEAVFLNQWSAIEWHINHPFSERLTILAAMQDLYESEFSQKLMHACPWLKGMDETVLTAFQSSLQHLSAYMTHYFEQGLVLVEASRQRAYSKHGKGTSIDWLTQLCKQHTMVWKRGDKVVIYPEGRTHVLTRCDVERLNTSFPTQIGTFLPF